MVATRGMLTQGRVAIFPLFIDCSRSLDVSAFAAQTLVQIVPCIRLAKVINMAASLEKTVEEHELHEEDEQDVEKAFLAHELAEHKAYPQKTVSPGLSRKFWVFAAINTLSTAGIVSLLVAHSYI
jgi:hypothetical protein